MGRTGGDDQLASVLTRFAALVQGEDEGDIDTLTLLVGKVRPARATEEVGELATQALVVYLPFATPAPLSVALP